MGLVNFISGMLMELIVTFTEYRQPKDQEKGIAVCSVITYNRIIMAHKYIAIGI